MDSEEYRLSAIMLADITGVNSSSEDDRNPPPEAMPDYTQIMRKHTEVYRGRIVQNTDSNVLVDFPSTINAVNCATHIQRELHEFTHNDSHNPAQIKLIVHFGDIRFLEQDASGEGIDIAKWLSSISIPGQICISEDVYNLVRNKIEGVSVKKLGSVNLASIDRNITAYEISVSEEPESTPASSATPPPRPTTPDPLNFPYNIRQRQHTENVSPVSTVPIPDRRGYDEDDKENKRVEREWDLVLESSNYQDQQLIQEYRRQTYQGLKRLETGFRGNLGSYLAVNIGLFAFWLIRGAGFPWFFFPAAGWGMGIASHYFNLRNKRREARELQALPALSKQQLKKLRSFHRERSKFSERVVSTVSISAFLFGINLITTGLFPFWSVFPIVILGCGLLINLPTFRSRKKQLFSELRETGVPVDQLKRANRLKISFQDRPPNLNPMQAEAERLQAAVLAQITGMRDKSFLGENFEQVLNDYVTQVVELSKKDAEIHNTLSSIPMTTIENELLDLQRQHEKAGNPTLKVELEKTMESIRKQQNSYIELQRQQQLLKARLSNAINSLRQLQLDLVRMKQAPEIDELPPVDQLLTETGEIHHYLSDLEVEYRRLEAREKDQ